MDALEEFFGEALYSEPTQPKEEGAKDLDFMELVPTGYLLPSFKLGQASFILHPGDVVAVLSPKAKEATWTVKEVLTVFGYMLSSSCKQDTCSVANDRKKGAGSHLRSSYSQVLCDTLYAKWVAISERWFLQIDRYHGNRSGWNADFQGTVQQDGFPSAGAERYGGTFTSTGMWYTTRLPSDFTGRILDRAVACLCWQAMVSVSGSKQQHLNTHPKTLKAELFLLLSEYCTSL